MTIIDDQLLKVQLESGRLLDDASAEFLTALRQDGVLSEEEWAVIVDDMRSALVFLAKPRALEDWDRDPRNQDWLRIASATRLAGHHMPAWATLWLWRLRTDTSSGFWRQVARSARRFGCPHIYPAEYFETRFRVATPLDVWPRAFVIITAWATTGEVWADEQNTQADAALEAELRAEGRWLVRVTGYSPTTSHAEPGWAVDLRLHDALEVGRRYKQDAIYVVRRDVLSVIRCAPEMPMAFVGRFSGRVDAGG